LQRLFQKTSDLLYEASQHKAYFKEVNFIIPKSWPTNTMSITKTLGLKKTRTQTIGNADFVVKQSGMCRVFPFSSFSYLIPDFPHLLILIVIVCE
jgi:hypothetical protein